MYVYDGTLIVSGCVSYTNGIISEKMNWMECGRKHSPDFRHNPGILLVGGGEKYVKCLRIISCEADV
jgi:hypothetical protein